jgi:hypothetical protein
MWDQAGRTQVLFAVPGVRLPVSQKPGAPIMYGEFLTVKKPRKTPSPEMLLANELGREGRILEETDVVQLLKSAIEREGGQGAFARRHIIDRAYLNQMLNGKKPINSAVMKALGFRKVYAP